MTSRAVLKHYKVDPSVLNEFIDGTFKALFVHREKNCPVCFVHHIIDCSRYWWLSGKQSLGIFTGERCMLFVVLIYIKMYSLGLEKWDETSLLHELQICQQAFCTCAKIVKNIQQLKIWPYLKLSSMSLSWECLQTLDFNNQYISTPRL